MSPDEVVERFLEQAGITYKRAGDQQWGAQLRGERKLTIPVMITITGERIAFESFFMRAPMENKDRFFEVLLRRNMRAYGVHFALDAQGDVFIVGSRTCEGLNEKEMDRIMGAILVEADGMFDVAIAIGFASYLEADLRWRARNTGG